MGKGEENFKKLMDRQIVKVNFDTEFKRLFREYLDGCHEELKHKDEVPYRIEMRKKIRTYMDERNFYIDTLFVFELYKKGNLK